MSEGSVGRRWLYKPTPTHCHTTSQIVSSPYGRAANYGKQSAPLNYKLGSGLILVDSLRVTGRNTVGRETTIARNWFLSNHSWGTKVAYCSNPCHRPKTAIGSGVQLMCERSNTSPGPVSKASSAKRASSGGPNLLSSSPARSWRVQVAVEELIHGTKARAMPTVPWAV